MAKFVVAIGYECSFKAFAIALLIFSYHDLHSTSFDQYTSGVKYTNLLHERTAAVSSTCILRACAATARTYHTLSVLRGLVYFVYSCDAFLTSKNITKLSFKLDNMMYSIFFTFNHDGLPIFLIFFIIFVS